MWINDLSKRPPLTLALLAVAMPCLACIYDMFPRDADGGAETGGAECVHSINTVEGLAVKDKWDCSISRDVVDAIIDAIPDEEVLDNDEFPGEDDLGFQVRVHTEGGHEAVCTVRAVHEEQDVDVGLTLAGLARLDAVGPTVGCVPGMLVPRSLSRDQAKEEGEVIEYLTEGEEGADSLILVPHGSMHPGTEMAADTAAEYWFGGTPHIWKVEGWAEEEGPVVAKEKWYVQAVDFHRWSWEALAYLEKQENFERVLSVLGHDDGGECGGSDVMVGGANEELRSAIIEDLSTLAEELGLDGQGEPLLTVGEATSKGCAGVAPGNIVNRLSMCGGVQLSLGSDLRSERSDLIHDDIMPKVAQAFGGGQDNCPND